MQRNDASRTRTTIYLLAASLALNVSLLIAIAWGVSSGLLLPVGLPVLIVVTAAEVFLWSRFAGKSAVQAVSQESEARITAMRRSGLQRRQSMTDEATGLYSRWYFERRIVEEAARCKRYHHSMAVVVLKVGAVSITTFSSDEWQQRFLDAAKRAANTVREVDISAALAPFEFGICLVHCDRQGAFHALDRLLRELPEYNCEAGVAVYPDEGYEPEGLLDIASARVRAVLPTIA